MANNITNNRCKNVTTNLFLLANVASLIKVSEDQSNRRNTMPRNVSHFTPALIHASIQIHNESFGGLNIL